MKNDTATRLKKVIENDRMSVTAEGVEVILKDLQAVLSEYFYILEKPTLSISAKGGEYKVNVSFTAENLKPFTRLP